MNIVGPTRLILIHAGIYDYGEVEMVRPLHLIGPNNVGKTSLITTLQFLYIDDQRHMHFPRDMGQTRRYYFPDINSYVLFECMTPTGFQVFGIRGLGPLRQYDIQRFAYQGRFDRADFMDQQRRMRDGDEIKMRLSTRNYVTLEPRHLRAALTGIGESKDVHLGLLPLRHRGHYRRFRAVFRNLLRLAHLRQEELKVFLIEIHSGEFQQKSIDLGKDYSGQYEKVRRGANELQDLQAIEPDARRLVALATHRNSLTHDLPGLWDRLMEVYAAEDAKQTDEITRLEDLYSTLESERNDVEAERGTVQGEIGSIAEQRGALGQRLSELKAQEEEFAEFIPDFEQQRLNRLQDRIDEIGANLKHADIESPERLRARIKRYESELKDKHALLARLAQTAAAWLSGQVDKNRFEDLFSLFNPALLGLPMGDDGIRIMDKQSIEQRIMSILNRITDRAYSDPSVRVRLSAVPQQDLTAFTDPERIQERIQELTLELKRDRTSLETAQNMEQLRLTLKRIHEQKKESERRYWRYEQYQENRSSSEEWHRSHQALVQQEEKRSAHLVELDRRRDRTSEQLRQVSMDIEALKKEGDRCRQRIRNLTRPDPEWPQKTVANLPEDLDTLIQRYETAYTDQERCSRELSSGLSGIKSRTYGRFDRDTESETLQALAEELDALKEKEQAVRELWTGLAAGLGNAFKALNRDLDTLKSRVDELNRNLSKISVSNLARLRLIVKEHPEWVNRIRTIAMDEDMPLFSDRTAVDSALERLGELLGRYPEVRLIDMFDLNFEVTTSNGTSRTYPHLESIESNGTTITIKVLINLMLLRGLMGQKEASIPFYLDEASSLDHENLFGIVQKAQELGFVPVLASPDAMDAADNLYFLQEHNGRVVLESQTSLVRIHRERTATESEEIHAD